MLNREGGEYNMRNALFRYRSQHTWEVYLHIQQGSEFCTQRCTMALTGIWHSGQGGIGKRNGKKRERGGKFLASRQGEGEKCRRSVTGLLALARGGLLCFAGPVPSPSFFCPVTSFISFPSLPPSFLPLNPCILSFPLEFRKELHLIEGHTTIIWYQKQQQDDQQRIDFGRFHILPPPLISIRSDFIHYNLHFPWVQIVVYLKKN